MKITDLSIESNNVQIEYLSKQEANKITGGVGVPGMGGDLTSSCTYVPSTTIQSSYSYSYSSSES